MGNSKKQPDGEKISKKQLTKTVLEKLTSSLAPYQLKEKKLETRLEKVSRRLAADIVKHQEKAISQNGKAAEKKKAGKLKTVSSKQPENQSIGM